MTQNLSIFELFVNNSEEMKIALKDMGFSFDEEDYVLNEKKQYVLDSQGEPIHLDEISSIMPGSKVIIKENDITALSEYYFNKVQVKNGDC